MEIPESAIRAVSKKMNHYINVQRREEGFDLSPSYNNTGYFSSGRGTAGTFHFNSLQDRHLQHFSEQPLARSQLEELGLLQQGMRRKTRKRAKSASEQQRMSTRTERERLLSTTAELLLSSGYCFYYKEPSTGRDLVHSQSPGTSSRQRKCSVKSSLTHSTDSKPPSTPSSSKITSSHTSDSPSPNSTSYATLNTVSCRNQTCTPVTAPPLKCNVGVSTVHYCEASTQTSGVDASTQTHLSKLLETSMRVRLRRRKKTRSVSKNSLGVGSSDEQSTSPLSLHGLAQAGDIGRLKEIVNADLSSVNTLNEQGQSLLHVACIAGNDQLTKVLCELGCELSVETPTGYTATHCAALHGHTHCLKVLASLGCEIGSPTIDGQTPLHLAARNGHVECCEWLAANGASVYAEDSGGRTPGVMATDNGHTALGPILSTSASC